MSHFKCLNLRIWICHNLNVWVLSQFEFLNLVTNWIFSSFSQFKLFSSLFPPWQFVYCSIVTLYAFFLSQFVFWSFVTILFFEVFWQFEFLNLFTMWFKFWSIITILNLEFRHNSNFKVLSQIMCLGFVKFSVFQFRPNSSFIPIQVLYQFKNC